ncbi:Oxysterol-binding protein-domain-containing protein, partial [Absidia repens]
MLAGWLLKKRRKKMQGWAKRWFQLTCSGTLSYSFSPTTKVRGLVHIPMSIITSKPKALAFHINTGNNTYYHLKAFTTDEYANWATHFKRLRVSNVETQVDHFEQWRHKRQSVHLTSIVKDKARGDVSRGLQASQLVKEKLLCLDKWIQGHQQNQMQSDWVSRLIQLKNEVDIAVKRQDQLWHVVQDTVWQADPFGLNRAHLNQDSDENSHKSNRISVDSALSETFYDAEDVKVGLSNESDQTQFVNATNAIEEDEKNEKVRDQHYGGTNMNWPQQNPVLPHRRRQLPSVAVGEISSALSIFRKNVGNDLSTIALPVSMNEPMSILQRACEELEYSELLDKACKLDTPMERLMYVTVFAITSYASSQYRTGRKPFNPMMNETYENIRPDKGFRFISEKVCHHPLTIAAHAESKNYIYWQCTKVKSKFWGKSMEFITEGVYHVQLTGHEDHYTYSKPSSWIRNMIAGEKYIEHSGEMKVTNNTTGDYAIVTFKEGSGGGLFGAPTKRNDIVANFYTADNDKRARRRVVGKWSGTLSEEVDLNKKHLSELWTAQIPDVEDYEAHYGFTRFCVELNEITELEKNQLPLTDTRYRPDQRLYELGFVDEADVKKKQIEQKQRDRRHDFELKGIPWNSRWF